LATNGYQRTGNAYQGATAGGFAYQQTTEEAVTTQPSGGWPIYAYGGKRRRWDFLPRPTDEEVRLERERLGILPPAVQRAVEAVVEARASAPESYESAIDLANRTVEEAVKLKGLIRKQIPDKRATIPSDAVFIAQTLILARLQKRFEAQQAEDSEIGHILALWLSM
jgi:hypothetical protein